MGGRLHDGQVGAHLRGRDCGLGLGHLLLEHHVGLLQQVVLLRRLDLRGLDLRHALRDLDLRHVWLAVVLLAGMLWGLNLGRLDWLLRLRLDLLGWLGLHLRLLRNKCFLGWLLFRLLDHVDLLVAVGFGLRHRVGHHVALDGLP